MQTSHSWRKSAWSRQPARANALASIATDCAEYALAGYRLASAAIQWKALSSLVSPLHSAFANSESERGPEPGHVPGKEGEPGALDVPLVVLAAEGPSRQGRVRQQAHVAVPLGANLQREARGKKEEKCAVVRVSEGVSQGETRSRRDEWDSPRTSSSRTAIW